jgi:hypothetical protein
MSVSGPEFTMLNEDDYREESALDAIALQSMLRGVVAEQATMKMVPHRKLRVEDVFQKKDERGMLLPWFTVLLESGVKLAVMVAPLPADT